MTAPEDPPGEAHDPELNKLLRSVEELSAVRHARGPDAFLERVDALAAELQALRKYRSDRALSARLEEYAAHRFALVDDASEYGLAADEVLVLSIVLAQAPELVTRALQRSVSILSGVLLEEGVPALFGQLLKRLRDIARWTKDPVLEHWVAGVIKALPGDTPPGEAPAWVAPVENAPFEIGPFEGAPFEVGPFEGTPPADLPSEDAPPNNAPPPDNEPPRSN